MKIEVVVDKDNTHFNYMLECDKVIDGTRSRILGGGVDVDAKLVILKKVKDGARERTDTHIEGKYTMETIAVFNSWTFWRILPDDAAKCTRCGHFNTLPKRGLCQECLNLLPESAR